MPSSSIKKLVVIGLVALLVVSAFVGLFLIDYEYKEQSSELQVVTTFYPLYYFASEIGGDRAKVTSLIPNNMEPHSWNPKPSDLITTSRADVFIYNGAGFEPWADSFIDQLGGDVTVVDTSQNVALGLSDEVEAVYLRADQELLSGPFIEAQLTYGPSYDQVGVQEGCYNLTLTTESWGNISAIGGSIWLNISEAGDYRLFLDAPADVALFDENGTMMDLEMLLDEVAGHPSFEKGVFLELPNGITRLSLNRTTSEQVHMVVLQVQSEGEGHEHGLNDPHFWLDPLSAKVQVDNIVAAFVQADPGNATYYRTNAQDLKGRLDELNQAFLYGLEGRTKNDIVTTHEGFNYLATRYGFQAHAAIGISGDEQPSANDIARLTDLIDELGLHYVFSEPTFSDAIIEQISAQTGAEVLILDGVHSQSGVDADKDYFEIMYANLASLQQGLEVNSDG
jgi:zinc transport system substrate-binding protein